MGILQLSKPQLEVLNMMSFIKSEDTYLLMKTAVSDFFAKEADRALDALWDEGLLNDEKVESFRNLHERTPYK